MATGALRREAPSSYDAAAALLRHCADEGLSARVSGGGTKLGWGRRAPAPDVELSTRALDAIAEHNAGDLTAVLQAGVPLARAQAAFAEADQMLALDPPLGAGDAATIGGVVASGDSGPLRHRYGAARDLVLGVTVALSDGSVARAGGKVIKNVAGYDLGKLFAGSFGTLGAIVEVAVRLHPLRDTASAAATADDPERLALAARRLAHASLEAQALDVAWREGRGGVLVRFAGAEAPAQAEAARVELDQAGLDAIVIDDDSGAWAQQRERQRGELVVRVSGVQTGLADLLRAADELGGSVVGRAALGLSWLTLPADTKASALRHLRSARSPAHCTVLDAPDAIRAELDPWGLEEGPELELMRSVKARFDPQGVVGIGVLV
jgi:glycolate oxidase FAD binding subunit